MGKIKANILENIISCKHKEVEERKKSYPVKLLEKSVYYNTEPVSLVRYLKRDDLTGIIAEIKRKSPAKGMINEFADIKKISTGYVQAGASALSVLTDSTFFGGSNNDLSTARKFNFCPILRKDFIVDEYQITEAKSIGADVILLIAAAVKPIKTMELAKYTKSLGMEVLLEVRSEKELQTHTNKFVDIIGVNNRWLKDFSVDIGRSLSLADKIPDEFIKISESGISSPEIIYELKSVGFSGFLIGESFMKSPSPHIACADFIRSIKEYELNYNRIK